MRQIKFRAWDKLNQEMCLVQKIRFSEFSEDKVLVLLPKCKAYHSNTQLELMQFTGLKDKNGIEIYDGDILKSDNLDASISIKWSEIWACWECEDLSSIENFGLLSNISLKNYLVIGNIYENPELLRVNDE